MSAIDLKKIQVSKKNSVPAKEGSSGFQKLMSLLNKDLQLPGSGTLDDSFKEGFYAGLSLLLSEGIDLKSAFTIMAEENEKAKVRSQLEKIKEQIIQGQKLADAMKANGNFSNYEIYSLTIGEESGMLIEIIRELSVYFQRKVKLKRQMVSALVYPAIILAVSLGAVTFMLNFVVPMFSEVFKRFKGNLPSITEWIIQASAVFHSTIWWLLSGIVVVVVTLYSQREKDWFRNYGSKLVMNIPVLGKLLRKIYLARFCQSHSLLLRSRVPIIQSLQLLKNMIRFYPIEITMDPIQSGILKGDSLHASLARYPIYDRKMISMVKVAEDVNKLDEMLAKLAFQFSEETEHQIELFNKLLEPVLIIILGVLVGGILVAMYLPLFQLGSQISA